MTRQTNPVLPFLINKSDIIHYWQGGDAIVFHIITEDGKYRRERLSGCLQDVKQGASMQVAIEGGCWKAQELEGEYCLIGVASAPGFDYADFSWGTEDKMRKFVDEETFHMVSHLFRSN